MGDLRNLRNAHAAWEAVKWERATPSAGARYRIRAVLSLLRLKTAVETRLLNPERLGGATSLASLRISETSISFSPYDPVHFSAEWATSTGLWTNTCADGLAKQR